MKRPDAHEWLERHLKFGQWYEVAKLYEAAEQDGLSASTLKRAWGLGKMKVHHQKFKTSAGMRLFLAFGERPQTPPEVLERERK
jgi:hypothetical protein